MLRTPTLTALLLGAFTACDPTSIPAPPPPTRTVVGRYAITYLTAKGPVEMAVDLSLYKLIALVPSDDQRSFTELPGVGRSDGTFRMPNVPEGPYTLYLRRDGRDPGTALLITSSADRLDLGYDVAVRPDAILPKQAPTPLVIDAGPMAPWQKEDDLRLAVPGLGRSFSLLQGSLTPTDRPPRVGDTALSGLTIDWSRSDHFSPLPLIQREQGDEAWLSQLTFRDLGNLGSYLSLARIWKLPPFQMADGLRSEVRGSFATVPQELRRLRWQRSAFAALTAQISKQANDPLPPTLMLSQLPWDPSRGVVGEAPATLVYTPSQPATDVDVSLSDGAGYPETWPRIVSTEEGVIEQHRGMNARKPVFMTGTLRVTMLLTNPAELDVRPQIGPVTDVLFNGLDIGGQLGEPEGILSLSWRPPAVGSATGYRVDLFEFDTNFSEETEVTHLARFYTSQSRILVPPDFRRSEHYYLFRITAFATPGANMNMDMEHAPLRRTLPESSADRLVSWVQF